MYFCSSFNDKNLFMSLITSIKTPIQEELQLFEKAFAASLQSGNPLLSSVNEYVRQGNGKQLRPILVLLCAKMCGTVNQSTIESAISLELLHTASLIHDDVVDDTFERRGRKSVNAQWNNKVAVLSGDYMLSNALNYATKTQNLRILELISNIGMQLSDGELLQLMNTEQSAITEEDYYNIIRKKTALLFSTCTEIGALSVCASENQRECLRNYGEYLGVCFQLKDDIFDYNEHANIGKPTGNDIRDGKLTLPLIYALRNTSGNEKERILRMIKDKDFTPENVHDILSFAHENGGIAYAEKQMDFYKKKALAEIADFPDNAIKQSLLMSAEFAVERKK